MNANIKGWSLALFPRVRHRLVGFLSLCLHAPFRQQRKRVHRAAVAAPRCRNAFEQGRLSLQWDLDLPGLLLARGSFVQSRKGTPSGRDLAERVPLGRQLAKGLLLSSWCIRARVLAQ